MEQLEKLASAGYIEQRSAPRTDIHVPAKTRRETLVEDLHVEITNLSETGFCFSSPQVMTPGARVLVDTESEGREVAIPAHVRWSGASEDDRFSAGCEFVDTSSFQYLKQHLAGKNARDSGPGQSRLLTSLLVTTIVVGVALKYFALPQLAAHVEQMGNTCLVETQTLVGVVR